MGPQSWKADPKNAIGKCVAGVLRDGDVNILLKWAGDNGLKVNPDETTYDATAINLIAANDFAYPFGDYNKQVHNYRDWEVPPQIWEANLRPKLEGIQEALDFLVPHLTALLPETAATR